MDALMKYVSRIHRCFRLWQSNQMVDQGLSGLGQNYLFHINKRPGISQEQLTDLMMVNKSNVARQLSMLESQGWIERKVSAQDKRVYEVFLTEQGQQLIPMIYQLMIDWNTQIIEDLTDQEKDILFQILPKITKKANQLIESERERT